MAVGGTTLFAGDWEIEVRLDGRTVEPADWSCVCWQSDDDGDYFELQSRPDGLRIERQIFLSRTDDFALLADIVVADPEHWGDDTRLESRSRWTLAPDAALIAQTRTRECRLLFGGRTARAFPLGLNCPRVEGVSGHLISVDGRMELSQTGIGGLYAPWCIDWNPRRRRSPAAWRRLTVAYARCGLYLRAKRPVICWKSARSNGCIYRSLLPALEPRSVLGQHTMYESLWGVSSAATWNPWCRSSNRLTRPPRAAKHRAANSQAVIYGRQLARWSTGGQQTGVMSKTVLVRYGAISEVSRFVNASGSRSVAGPKWSCRSHRGLEDGLLLEDAPARESMARSPPRATSDAGPHPPALSGRRPRASQSLQVRLRITIRRLAGPHSRLEAAAGTDRSGMDSRPFQADSLCAERSRDRNVRGSRCRRPPPDWASSKCNRSGPTAWCRRRAATAAVREVAAPEAVPNGCCH